MLETSAVLLDVDKNEFTEFEVVDTFNNNHRIKGVICQRSDYRYGALVIFQVNEEPCEQIIWGTPKLKLPFDKRGNFNWPEVETLEVWEKVDGTNIMAFRYQYQGESWVTYKTRLSPIVKDTLRASFASMWEECLSTNPWITTLIKANPSYNLSFELFGSRNPITVMYTIPLDVRLLFGIHTQTHDVLPPSKLNSFKDTKLPEKFSFDKDTKLTKIYNGIRALMSTKNQGNDIKAEGTVFYAEHKDGSFSLFKCKPDEIERISWSSSKTIPKIVLWNTALNVFESVEHPNLDDFGKLLKEDFTDEQIENSDIKIAQVFKEALGHVNIMSKINTVWKSAQERGFDISKDKASTMRFVSNHFDKKSMKKVGTLLLRQAGLLK